MHSRQILFAAFILATTTHELCAQTHAALTPADAQWIIARSMGFRSQLVRDSVRVDACSAYRLLGADSARVKVLADVPGMRPMFGSYGPNCRVADPPTANTLELLRIEFTTNMPDSLILATSPEARFGVATLVAFVRAPGTVPSGYTESFVFKGVRTGNQAARWELMSYVASRFQRER